jgi:hypothetical protein
MVKAAGLEQVSQTSLTVGKDGTAPEPVRDELTIHSPPLRTPGFRIRLIT